MELDISLDSHSKEVEETDFLIIGGGVAGLAAANRLAEAGVDVALLEEGVYPAHKICGEFLSPEALPLLADWGITPNTLIDEINLIVPTGCFSMKLPKMAGTIQRYILDEALANRATSKGARIQKGAKVNKIDISETEKQRFVVTLASGQRWKASTLLLSTGRLMSALTGRGTPKFYYIGAKAHFGGINLSYGLVMHLMPGAYFGMAPVGVNRFNVAGIMTCTPEQAQNPRETFASFFESANAKSLRETLKGGHCLFDNWMIGAVPEFGIRKNPQWPKTFFLGDAAGVIPPATGNGLAMALTSGILAADYALKGDPDTYRIRWNEDYRKRISRGKLLHRLFLSASLSKAIPLVGRILPFLPRYVFQVTRGSL